MNETLRPQKAGRQAKSLTLDSMVESLRWYLADRPEEWAAVRAEYEVLRSRMLRRIRRECERQDCAA
jgi:hypothetical protein